ncbi:MAG: pilin, partial [bacterium]
MQKNILKKSKRFAIFFVFFILLAHFVFVPSPSKGKGRVRLFPAPQYVRAAGATETWRETDRTWLEKISHPLSTATGENKELTYPDLAVPVGGFTKDSFKGQPPQNWLGVYILAWFHYLIGAIGIIAVVMIMWGGIKWITAGGNASQVDDAKGKIKNAVMGIVLLLCTYTIFKTINPRMLSLQLPTIESVDATPICCKDNTTSKKRTAYNECNKDASGNALETK